MKNKTIYLVTLENGDKVKMASPDYGIPLKNNSEDEFIDVSQEGELSLQDRYLLFAGTSHYPHGGLEDLLLTTDNIKDIESLLSFGKYVDFADQFHITLSKINWFHVFDTKKNKIIKKEYNL